MKNKFLKISLIFSIFALIVSCDQDDLTDDSTMRATGGNATINLSFDSTMSFVEKNETYEYTITLAEPQIVDIHIPVLFAGGTATEGDDFAFDHEVVIKANTTGGSGTITTYTDDAFEETETLSIQIGAASESIANASLTPQTIDITLENFVSDDLEIVFDWDNGDIFVAAFGDAFPVCPNTDVDVYVADAAGFDITNPFANLIFDFAAATGDCPEDWTFSFNDYPDGEYVFFTDLWSNEFSGFANDGSLSVTTTFVRAGSFTEVVEQDPSQAYQGTTPAGSFNGFIAKVKIENGLYSIFDYSGTELVSGKSTGAKVKRPLLNKPIGSSELRR